MPFCESVKDLAAGDELIGRKATDQPAGDD